MNRQSVSFVLTFLVAAAAVAAFVYNGQPLYGVGAGVGGLLVHWLVSRGGNHEGEVADSSYFFGFLLTLVFLVVGLYRIGVQAGTGGAVNILSFLEDLAAGLALTVTGLLIRQIRTLATAPESKSASTPDVMSRLVANLETMTELWRARPEHQVVDLLDKSRSAAREAAEQLDRSIASAGERMLKSVERLDEATTAASQSLTRAASGVSSSITEVAQRLEVEIQQVLAAVQQARAQHEQQLEVWQKSLEQARAALAAAQRGLEEEYRLNMEGFATTGEAFRQLAEQATMHVQSLPDPAERLAGLWDGVRQLETDLTEAIAGSIMELGALRERSEELNVELRSLGVSAEQVARQLGTGGDQMAAALRRELEQMSGIIEEYVRMLEKTPPALKVRA